MDEVQRLTKLNLKTLPPRGTGLLLGRAGERRFGRPRTYAQRLARHPGVLALSPTLSIQPTVVDPNDSLIFTLSGFVEGGDGIYIDFLSGPDEFGPYPTSPYRFPGANGSYTTAAPWCKGTYVARARQETLLSNEVTFNVGAPPSPPPETPEGIPLLAIVGAIIVAGVIYFVTK
jgi:hypothetical protein